MLPLKDVNPTRHIAFVTMALVAACVGTWLFWQQEPSRDLVDDLVFNYEFAAIPCEIVQGEPLDTVEFAQTVQNGNTEACGVGDRSAPPLFADKSVWLAVLFSMFFHGGVMHIVGNMLFLWIFGNNIEDHMGPIRYLGLYVVGGVVATLAHVALQPDSTVPLVGASGAVAAVMGTYLFWFPNAPVRTLVFLGLPLLITVRAKWLLAFWFVSQFFTNPNSGVAWGAHVGGFVFGALIGLAVRSSNSLRRLLWRSAYRQQMDRRHWDPTGGVGPVHEYHRIGRR